MHNQISLWRSWDNIITSYIHKVLCTEYVQSNVGACITVNGSIIVSGVLNGEVIVSNSVADLIKSNLTKSFHDHDGCSGEFSKHHHIMKSFDNIKILDYIKTIDHKICIHYSIDCYYNYITNDSVDYDFINETLNRWHYINMVDASASTKPLINKDESIIISIDRNGAVIGSMLSHITGIPSFNITYNDVMSLCNERSFNQMLHGQIQSIMSYMSLSHYTDIIIVTDIKRTCVFETIKQHVNKQCTYVEPRFHHVYIEDISKNNEHVKFPWELSLDIIENKE